MRRKSSMIVGAVFSVAAWIAIYGLIVVGMSLADNWIDPHDPESKILFWSCQAVIALIVLGAMSEYVVRTWDPTPSWFLLATGLTPILGTVLLLGLTKLVAEPGMGRLMLVGIVFMITGITTLTVVLTAAISCWVHSG